MNGTPKEKRIKLKKALLLINSIGCPRSVLLKLRVEDYLKANDWLIVSPSEIKSCDLVVFFGCGLINDEKQQSLRIVRDVKEQLVQLKNPPMFIVTGCLPPQNKNELLQIHDGPAFGPLELERFDDLINATVRIADIPSRNKVATSERVRVVIGDRKRDRIIRKLVFYTPHMAIIAIVSAYYKILNGALFYNPDRDVSPFDSYQIGDQSWCILTSVGCLGNCSYCISKFAKGSLKSRPPQEVIEEARQGIKLGYKWISLIADDNGVYGRDIGTNLGTLLRELTNIEGDFNILIDSLNTIHFIKLCDEFPDIFTSGKINRICLAIQHVNPRILSSMNRSYDVDQLKQHIHTLSIASPEFIIDAHYMIGYPGETEEEFEELLSFAEWLLKVNPLNSFKTFIFTADPRTVAGNLGGQLSKMVIHKRALRLDQVRIKHRYTMRKSV